MPIRYKIIHKESRISAYVDSIFKLSYIPGKKVTAAENTLGIFVYARRKDAENELYNVNTSTRPETHKIIRVQAHGRGTKLKIRPANYEEYMIVILGLEKKDILRTKGQILPKKVFKAYLSSQENDGTMLYQSVTPLD